MADLLAQLERARAHIETRWGDERAQRVSHGITRKSARTRQRKFALALGVAAIAILLSLQWKQEHLSRVPKLDAVATTMAPSTISEDFTATALDDASVLEPVERTHERVLFRIARGGATFTVTHRPSRLFRVEVGPVVIEDIGTVFTASHETATSVRVSVKEGRVSVSWLGQHTELAGGESRVFQVQADPKPERNTRSMEAVAPRTHRESSEDPASWRTLARDGKFDGAYEALKSDPSNPVTDDVEDLLLSADVARLSHHPVDAVDPLRKVIQHHRSDARAPLAAFTLGRVLLDELSQPAEAAEVFHQARALAPRGPLASDALAREVEACSRSGQTERAKTLAEEYVRQYPSGSRLRSVMRFGLLE